MYSRNNNHSSEEEFITQVYQEFNRLMYFTAQKYTSDPYQCEDIVQESLIRLINKIDTLRKLNKTTLASYITITVRNTSINYISHQKKTSLRVLSLEDIGQEIISDNEISLDEKLIDKEKVKEMRKVWAQLDDDTKKILEGKYILGYDNIQLAKLLKCRPNSIRMKLTRARRKAFELLKDGGSE